MSAKKSQDKRLRVDAEQIVNPNVSSPSGAQLLLLRDLALAIAREVEGFKFQSDLERLSDSSLPKLEDGISLSGVVRRYEISLITRALIITNGNQVRASRLLGLNATTLNAKMKRYALGAFRKLPRIEQEMS